MILLNVFNIPNVYAVEINSIDLAPSAIQVVWKNNNQQYGQYNSTYTTSYDGTIKSYDVTYSFGGTSTLFKMAINYNLAGIPSDYISFFIIDSNGFSPLATLSGYPCEAIRGMYNQVILNQQVEENTIISGSTGYLCRNPRKDNVWLDLNYNIDSNGANPQGGKIRIASAISYYSDSTVQQAIQNLQTQVQNNQQEMMNADANADMTPNTSNDYTQNEQQLITEMNKANFTNVEIALDNNSNNFVWQTMTRLLESNALIMGLFISILSIGIIKLVLGR